MRSSRRSTSAVCTDVEKLWSPWRSRYVTESTGDDADCIFCAALDAGDDERMGVLHRTDSSFVLLNAYPYNSGHVMVAPTDHAAELSHLSPEQRHDLIDLVSATAEVLRQAMGPHGFNIGVNLGRVAGAGVPGHVHVHVVPRWGGDTNFMPVVGETKVLPEDLEQTYRKLKPGFGR